MLSGESDYHDLQHFDRPFPLSYFSVRFIYSYQQSIPLPSLVPVKSSEYTWSKSRRCWWVFYWHLMSGDAFEVLTQWYFKFRILSHKDICTVLVCLSRKYSLCIKLSIYHSSSRSHQLNTYQVDIFYPSTGPSLLMLRLVNMISQDFLETFPSNKTMQFPWAVSSTATSVVTLVCPKKELLGLFRQKKKQAQGRPYCSLQQSERARLGRGGVRLFFQVTRDRKKGNGPKLQQGRFRLGIKRNYSMERIVKLWIDCQGIIIPLSVHRTCVYWTWGHGLVVNMVIVLGWWLDLMILGGIFQP